MCLFGIFAGIFVAKISRIGWHLTKKLPKNDVLMEHSVTKMNCCRVHCTMLQWPGVRRISVTCRLVGPAKTRMIMSAMRSYRWIFSASPPACTAVLWTRELTWLSSTQNKNKCSWLKDSNLPRVSKHVRDGTQALMK